MNYKILIFSLFFAPIWGCVEQKKCSKKMSYIENKVARIKDSLAKVYPTISIKDTDLVYVYVDSSECCYFDTQLYRFDKIEDLIKNKSVGFIIDANTALFESWIKSDFFLAKIDGITKKLWHNKIRFLRIFMHNFLEIKTRKGMIMPTKKVTHNIYFARDSVFIENAHSKETINISYNQSLKYIAKLIDGEKDKGVFSFHVRGGPIHSIFEIKKMSYKLKLDIIESKCNIYKKDVLLLTEREISILEESYPIFYWTPIF